MQTKFTPLVKIKKQKLRDCEHKILLKNNQISDTKKKIDELFLNLKKVEPPKYGTFRDMLATFEIKKSFLYEIDSKKNELNSLQNDIKQLQRALKENLIEYEKSKHLDDIEMQKIINERNKIESERLNEVATILFNNRAKRNDA